MKAFSKRLSHTTRAAILSTLLVTLGLLVVTPPTPASACVGTTSGSSAFNAGCGAVGGGSDAPPPNLNWVPDVWTTETCTDGAGNPSVYVFGHNVQTGEQAKFCIRNGNVDPIADKVRLVTPQPKLDPDYKHDFLTQAPVKILNVSDMADKWRRIPEFHQYYLHVKPIKVVVKFGDDSPDLTWRPGDEPKIVHTYTKKETVTVKVTVDWIGVLHKVDEGEDHTDANADTQLQTITDPDGAPLHREDSVERNVVEVWSARTQPS